MNLLFQLLDRKILNVSTLFKQLRKKKKEKKGAVTLIVFLSDPFHTNTKKEKSTRHLISALTWRRQCHQTFSRHTSALKGFQIYGRKNKINKYKIPPLRKTGRVHHPILEQYNLFKFSVFASDKKIYGAFSICTQDIDTPPPPPYIYL